MTTSIKTPRLPSGIEDFAEIRQWSSAVDRSKLTIADKTEFLPELLGSEDKVTVFTRPIRFMKSSTLSMLECFLSIRNAAENKALFDGLAISAEEHSEFRARYQGQFPVIYLNLKNIQAQTWVEAQAEFNTVMSELYRNHSYVLSSLDEWQQNKYQAILNGQGGDVCLQQSLSSLATYLSTHYQKKVFILIDEYDTPLHRAHLYTDKTERRDRGSYFQLMTNFLGSFFGSALKGHPHVEKGFMTGVLRTAFASLVSSLNNAAVYSILSSEFAELFGFTEAEVEYFISQIEGISDKDRNDIRNMLRSWYNGYYMGNNKVRIYNPWSVAQFFNRLPASGSLAASPYWLQTGDSLALAEYLYPRFERLQPKLIELILRKTIEVRIDERTTLANLDDPTDDSAFWGLLLHAGYLNASRVHRGIDTFAICEVSIPNYEVAGAYVHLIYRYQKNCLLKDQDPGLDNYNDMLECLVAGDITKFAAHLKTYMEQVMSFHDIPQQDSQANSKIREQVYHAFMTGLLSGLHMRHFRLSSNRESGYGRYDMALIPSDAEQHGLIFELKATDDPNKLASESSNALKQIKEKHYEATLAAHGISSGIHIGLSFYGKRFSISYEKVEYPAVSNVEPLAELL